jgi:hypothetical protein
LGWANAAILGSRQAPSPDDPWLVHQFDRALPPHHAPSQGFDFNTCIGKGIPYMPSRQRDNLILQVRGAGASVGPPRSCSNGRAPSGRAAHSTGAPVTARRPHRLPPTPLLAHPPRQLERARERGVDQTSQQARVAVTDEDDRAFLEELAALVGAWLAEGPGGEPRLLLPPANGFRRLLTYQLLDGPRFIAAEGAHRGFVVVKVGGGGLGSGRALGRLWGAKRPVHRLVCALTRATPSAGTAILASRPPQLEQRSGPPCIALLRAATPEAAAELERKMFEEQVEAVRDAAGFAAVFDLMRASGKPAGEPQGHGAAPAQEAAGCGVCLPAFSTHAWLFAAA